MRLVASARAYLRIYANACGDCGPLRRFGTEMGPKNIESVPYRIGRITRPAWGIITPTPRRCVTHLPWAFCMRTRRGPRRKTRPPSSFTRGPLCHPGHRHGKVLDRARVADVHQRHGRCGHRGVAPVYMSKPYILPPFAGGGLIPCLVGRFLMHKKSAPPGWCHGVAHVENVCTCVDRRMVVKQLSPAVYLPYLPGPQNECFCDVIFT